MRKVAAIARLTVRAAVRYRVFAVLVIALALIAVVLPLTVKSDGTAAGYLQILLNYALGLATVVLSFATIWMACGSLSREIDEKQIHLVATKPVARWQIWVGKWLGLAVLTGALLAIAAVIVYGLMQWNLRPGRWPAEELAPLHAEVLTARRAVSPDLPDFEPMVDQALSEREASGDMPEDISEEEIRVQVREAILAQYQAVSQAYGIRWTFSGLPSAGGSVESIQLQFRFLCAEMPPAGTVYGEWRFGDPGRPDRFAWTGPSPQNSIQKLEFPAAMIGDDGTLVVDFYNVDPYPTTVVFPVDEGVEVLVPVGSFLGNYLRAVFVLWLRLVVLAALALTFASIASFPVAAFTSITLYLISISSGFLRTIAAQESIFGGGHHGEAIASGWIDGIFRGIISGVLFVVSNLQGYNPIGDLSTGRMVGWGWLARGVIVMVMVHGGMLAAIGILVLRRRELATAKG